MATRTKTAPKSRRSAGKSTKGSGTQSGLFALLKEDHKKVKSLFAKIEKNGDDDGAMQETFAQIQHELEVHMQGEEQFIYPAVQEEVEGDEEDKEKVLEAYEEHHVAKGVLAEIIDLPEDDERWKAKVKVLKEIVEHHIEEEEEELFKVIRQALDKQRLQQIENQMRELKEENAAE